MNVQHFRVSIVLSGLAIVLQGCLGFAQQSSDTAKAAAQQVSAERDGQHDFDFEVGGGTYISSG